MIVNFDEYSINEKFGYPDSIEAATEFITDFIAEKIRWWTDRKGVANYKDEFHIDMSDIDQSIVDNKDFPISHFNLKLSIVKVGKTVARTGIAGWAYPFKSRWTVDPNSDYSFTYRGKIHLYLEFKVYVSGESIQVQKLMEECSTVTRHELQHMYEGFKKLNKGLIPNIDARISVFSNALVFDTTDKYPKAKTFGRLMNLFYSISHEKEFNAYMAEFTSRKVKNIEEITAGNTAMKIWKYTKFEDLYEQILKEFKHNYPNVDLNSIPKFAVTTATSNMRRYKMPIPNWMSEYDKDFKGFLYAMWKKIQGKRKEFFERSRKNFYSRVVEFANYYPKNDPRNVIDPYGEEKWGDEEPVARLRHEDEQELPIVNRVMNMILRIQMDFDRPSLSREYYLNRRPARRIPRDVANNDIIEVIYTYVYDDATTLEVVKEYGPTRDDYFATKLNGEEVPLTQQQSRGFWRTCRGNY